MTSAFRFIALLALLLPFQLAHAQPTATGLPAATDAENIWVLDLKDSGRVRIALRPDMAPRHVERIKQLTRAGFYDGLTFHRVIPGFMAQGGDPTGDGSGGSDLPDLAAEFNALPHARGTASMARETEPDTANSQFFIMLAPRLGLDRRYTAFGRVISGMEYVDAIRVGEPPVDPTVIDHAWMEADGGPLASAPVDNPAQTNSTEDKAMLAD